MVSTIHVRYLQVLLFLEHGLEDILGTLQRRKHLRFAEHSNLFVSFWFLSRMRYMRAA